MNVIAFNGSARKDGNTAIMIGYVFEELQAEGIETELIQFAGTTMRGCTACAKCYENKDGRCVIDDDALNGYLDKMVAADGIILGSPTYFADVTAGMKAMMERAGFVARANDFSLRRKVGAAVVAVRRGGAIHVFDTLNHFFLIAQMIVPGSSYWNDGIGRAKGDVKGDAEAEETMRVLGKNMAWLLQKTNA